MILKPYMSHLKTIICTKWFHNNVAYTIYFSWKRKGLIESKPYLFVETLIQFVITKKIMHSSD